MAQRKTKFENQVAAMIGANIRALREKREIKPATVASWIGVTEDFLFKAEQGKRRLSTGKIVQLALHFDVSTDLLFFGGRPRPTLIRHAKFEFAA